MSEKAFYVTTPEASQAKEPLAPKAYYVTTPIYYVNDAPHIGHAYTTVAGDVLTRWHRQRGERVHFLTGTDEHGQKILRAAEAQGMTPQQWCDHMVETAWKPMLTAIDAANDDFIRTTEERHVIRVQEFWQRLHDQGEVYEGSYTGPYCVACEEFKVPGELLQPGDRCPIHDREVEMIAESNWFFRLSAYQQRLLAAYASGEIRIEPESARNEVLRFVEGGLQDISMSRSTFDWGITVPWDPSHVIYVWIDALLNYWTAVDGSGEYWPADVHLVGKDILRFHAVIWPAMLLAAGLPLPRLVFANGWLLVGGEKMSKTKLTGIPPQQITDHFGSDAYRYYFLRELTFGADGSFSWESMAARYSSELADQFGNLASRLTSMVERYRDGVLPEGKLDDAVATAMRTAVDEAEAAIDAIDFQAAIAAVMSFVRVVNGYVTEQAPWKVAKAADQDPTRSAELDDILYTTADALRATAVLLNPVMPKACVTLWASLGAPAPLAEARVQDAAADHLPAGAKVTKSEPLFPRLEA